jgi:hypothetical protein
MVWWSFGRALRPLAGLPDTDEEGGSRRRRTGGSSLAIQREKEVTMEILIGGRRTHVDPAPSARRPPKMSRTKVSRALRRRALYFISGR